jgi:hypothetical protein
MDGIIRRYVKRCVRLTAATLVGGMLVLLYLVENYRDRAAARVAVLAVMAVALWWSAWLKCPRCSYFFSRNDLARFTWPFLEEPATCPHCGVSLDSRTS